MDFKSLCRRVDKNERIIKLFTNKKNRVYYQYIADKRGISEAEAVIVLNELQNKTDKPLGFIINNRIDECENDEQIQKKISQAEKKIEKVIMSLCEMTGWTKEEAIKETDRIKEKFNIGAKSYYQRQFYLCTDEEIKQKLNAANDEEKELYKKIAKESGWKKKEIRQHFRQCNLRYGLDLLDYYYFGAWKKSFEELDQYATLKTTRALTRKYNKKTRILANKILFNEYFGKFTQRKYWVNRDTSYEEFLEFIDGLKYIFVKPINLMQGRGTEKIIVSEIKDTKALYNELMSRPKLLVEEGIIQHDSMSEIYPDSVNTVRIVTLYKDGQVHYLCSFVRFGCRGSIVDNLGSGGSIAGVDEKTGIIETEICDKNGVRYEKHPDTGKQIIGFQIPKWDEILEVTANAIKEYPNINYAGWDVAVCNDKVVIVEGNSLPGLAVYQLTYAHRNEGKIYKFEPYL